jgi:hypothetical protein
LKRLKLIQWYVGAIVVECCHDERWWEVESHDERLIVTIPRMPADIARIVFVNDVIGSGMAIPK